LKVIEKGGTHTARVPGITFRRVPRRRESKKQVMREGVKKNPLKIRKGKERTLAAWGDPADDLRRRARHDVNKKKKKHVGNRGEFPEHDPRKRKKPLNAGLPDLS